MSPIRGAGRTLATLLVLLGSAHASDLSDLDVAFRMWAGPAGSRSNSDSPFAQAAVLGDELGRGEADLRLRRGALTAELSARSTARAGETLATEGVVNELFYDADVLGQHLTVGKRVTSWDVSFGFRPLDVVQQENRRGLRPFALEGIPLLSWGLFGEETAWELVYANPLRGRATASRDDESAALRHFRRLGAADLHIAARWSERTRLQAGAAVAAVLGDGVEVHGSFRYQRRSERLVGPLAGTPGSLLAESNPLAVTASPDVVAALVGFVVNPGWNLSVLGEAWRDPAGGTTTEWRALSARARQQGALLETPGVSRSAVIQNLAWGLGAFERPNLLRENVLLRVSRKWERFEPAIDVLFTPADRGWVATAGVSYEGERTRLDGRLRVFGGPPGSAYRLFPDSAIVHAGWQVYF